MSDTPKFEVIDRRKYKAEEEEREAAQSQPAAAEAAKPEPGKPEPVKEEPRPLPKAAAQKEEQRPGPKLVPERGRAEGAAGDELEAGPELGPELTAEEAEQQKTAYDASAQRLEELVRAQNPGVGPQPALTFDHLVNQLYVSAMIQMGAGQEGQRARVDIMGAKQTIDLMGILAEKTRGNLTDAEERTLQALLYEVRMAFLELTNMITLQAMTPPAPPPGKR